jgi:hypothetical protein
MRKRLLMNPTLTAKQLMGLLLLWRTSPSGSPRGCVWFWKRPNIQLID